MYVGGSKAISVSFLLSEPLTPRPETHLKRVEDDLFLPKDFIIMN